MIKIREFEVPKKTAYESSTSVDKRGPEVENTVVKENLRSKKKLSSNERAWKMQKKRAIADLNAPNGSRDIPFQSQEFGQDGHCHFVGFQPHFQLNMTSQTQYFKTMKK